jgi:hypothetical protein
MLPLTCNRKRRKRHKNYIRVYKHFHFSLLAFRPMPAPYRNDFDMMRICLLRLWPHTFAVFFEDAFASRGDFKPNVDKNGTSAYFDFSQNRI